MAYVPYSTKFQQDVVRSAQKYALGLPSGPANYQNHLPTPPHNDWIGGMPAPGVLPNVVQGPRYHRRISGLLAFDWGAAHPAGGVERVRFYKVTHQHHPGNHGPMGGVFAAPTVAQAQGAILLEFTNAHHGFDAYYLPWTGWGGALYMTLPPGGPDYFFTAALSGCSVMIVGPANAPTVYHCGVDFWGPNTPYVLPDYAQAGDPPQPDPRFTHEMWVDLVAHVINDPNAAFEKASTIDKRHYVNDFLGTNQTTAGSRVLETALQHVKNDPAAMANPFGVVFGRKDGAGNWSFYLQANVAMTYGGHPIRTLSRPVEVIQFYPHWQTFAREWTF